MFMPPSIQYIHVSIVSSKDYRIEHQHAKSEVRDHFLYHEGIDWG